MENRSNSHTNEPTHEEIAQCSYLIWELEGRPQGRDQEHWFKAKSQLYAGINKTVSTENGNSSSQKSARKKKPFSEKADSPQKLATANL